MKKLFVFLFVLIMMSACTKYHYPQYIIDWEQQKRDGTWKMPEGGGQTTTNQSLPYVGMTEAQLENMWGRGSDSTYYSEANMRTTWYTRTLLGMLPGYKTGNPFYFQKYLIYIQNGKVIDYSIH